MRKGSRFLVFLLLCLVLLPTQLFAQGQQATTSAAKTKLTMFHYLDLTDATTAPNWDTLVARFNELYPDIELDVEYLYGEAYHNKLQAMAIAKQLPDVIFLWPGKRTGSVTGANLVKDLSPWLKGQESNFASMAMQKQGPNGEMWELPEQVTVTSVMYTNNKLLKELGLTLPKTLNELVAQGDKIRAAGLIPISMANKDGWQMQSCLASTLTERAGGMEWYKNAVSGNGAAFTDPEFINGLTVIKTLFDNKMFSPGINQADYMQGLDDFVNEKAVYLIDGGWMVNNMVGELTAAQKEYITLESFPDIPNQKGVSKSAAAVAGTGFGMNANLTGDKAEAAWKWIWFYSGPEGAKIRQSFGALPAYNLDVPADADVMVKKLANFVGSVPMGYVLDAVLDAEGINAFNANLQEMMFGNKTPKQVATELETWVAANDSSRK